MVGHSTPEFEFVDATKLGALLTDGKGVLLGFGAHPSLQSLASRWSDRIYYVACDGTNRFGLRAMLVRPDGIVAWAADATPDEHGSGQ